MADERRIVIKNAALVDGSGSPMRHADVAFVGDTITEVDTPGSVSTASAARVLDAQGRLVTPGFVDVHTHYDAQATWDPWFTPSSWHGVTTVVMGNCGVGFAPALPDRHEWLIELMEGVEDIPGSAMVEGITWEWESFPEYLDALERGSHVIDFGTQIAHGALRAFVMGDRGAANEVATADDIAAMSRLTEEALRAGALGFSTSRTSLHRSKSGELVPGTHAEPDELYGIADAMRRVGHGIFQFSPEHSRVPVEEWPWMQELARRSGATVSVNVNQLDDGSEVWRKTFALLDAAHRNGERIVAQVAGRSIGIIMCLEGSVHPLLAHPAYHEVMHLPFAERVAALLDPVRRARFVDEVPTDKFYEGLVTKALKRMYLVTDANIDYEPDPSQSVLALSQSRNVPAMKLIVDHMLSGGGKGMIYSPFFNYMYGDLSMTYELMQHPQTRNGAERCGRSLRGDLRRRNADVHAHPLGTRSRARTETVAGTRRLSPDAQHRGAPRIERPRIDRPRHESRHQRDRLRLARLRHAAHGLRPARLRAPARADRTRLCRHVRVGNPDRRRRLLHRRTAGIADPRTAPLARHAMQADEAAGMFDLTHVAKCVLVDPALDGVQHLDALVTSDTCTERARNLRRERTCDHDA